MNTLDLDATQTRSYECRAAADTNRREVSGIGVPLEVETEIWPGFREVFDQDCVFEGIERAKLKANHRTLIGVITNHAREAGKLSITGRASSTRDGDEALALAADGALDSFSIGFRAKEYVRTDHEDGSFTIRHTRVLTREFSLTDDPAYTSAAVEDVREATPAPPTSKEPTPMTITREDLDAATAELSEQIRSTQATLATLSTGTPAPAFETRSAGALLQALANGDEDAIRSYNTTMERAYDGGTTADAPIKDAWVGDLTRIFDQTSGVLSDFFATGVLPDTGMNIEYAELEDNTITVAQQENEGDALGKGNVKLTTKTAPVHTYGGATTLSIQQILRSTLPVLNRHMEALAMAAGANKKAELRAAYLALVAARKALAGGAGTLAIGAALPDATAADWTNIIVDAAIRYSKLNLTLDGAIVSPEVFKSLVNLETNGRRVLRVAEGESVGRVQLPGLRGDLASIQFVCDPDRTGIAAEFAHTASVRQYDSGVTQLQDENILNLSRDFSVYRFGAVAPEIPQGIVPVTFGA